MARLTITNSYRSLAGEPEGKTDQFKDSRRREQNIKIACEGVEWINLARVTGTSELLVLNVAMNFPSSTKRGKFLISSGTTSSFRNEVMCCKLK